MAAGKGAAGVGLEIVFEGGGLGAISERHGNFDAPGSQAGRARNLASIVFGQPLFRTIGKSRIVPVRVGDADELVNVVEHSLNSVAGWLARA